MLESSSGWLDAAIFYHIYPLGFSGAPAHNDFSSPPVNRLAKITAWLDHIQYLGANALYLGPLFESSAHGYDTQDYFQVDRRLGTKADLVNLSDELHRRGMRLVLDGVFNHVGRDFWAFKDVQAHGANSAYCDWFYRLNFGGRSPYNDPFEYEGWAGHLDLVKLNLRNPAVKKYLFEAVATWLNEFKIDGLRLDAADSLDFDFLRELAAFCRNLRPDFWLMGEVVHGDYRRWANSEMLDATTNYEAYKGLWSSHTDRNYFEIAYSLNRQFGEQGMYKHLALYNFADNHDVNRVASDLSEPAHIYPLYGLLFSMPGVPAIYYGSEWGLTGKRSTTGDKELRPCLDLTDLYERKADAGFQPELPEVISRLAAIRQQSPALRGGSYRQLLVQSEQLAFARHAPGETMVVAVNAAPKAVFIELNLAEFSGLRLVDLLNQNEVFQIAANGKVSLKLWPNWSRILRVV